MRFCRCKQKTKQNRQTEESVSLFDKCLTHLWMLLHKQKKCWNQLIQGDLMLSQVMDLNSSFTIVKSKRVNELWQESFQLFRAGLMTRGLGTELFNEQCDVGLSGSARVTAAGQIWVKRSLTPCSWFTISAPASCVHGPTALISKMRQGNSPTFVQHAHVLCCVVLHLYMQIFVDMLDFHLTDRKLNTPILLAVLLFR